MQGFAVGIAAFSAGAIPFSYLAARWARGIDLRDVGTGTVSGTSLYRVAGFGPLAAAGVCEIAKGAVGPALAGDRPVVRAVACGLAVAGHNWSPSLRGAGGRGISPALGAFLVTAWPGTLLLGAGLAIGRLLSSTALVCLLAVLLLTPVLALSHGAVGALAGAVVTVAMLAKRMSGNRASQGPRVEVLRNRLLYDRDDRPAR